jgi:hypothetical protein
MALACMVLPNFCGMKKNGKFEDIGSVALFTFYLILSVSYFQWFVDPFASEVTDCHVIIFK